MRSQFQSPSADDFLHRFISGSARQSSSDDSPQPILPSEGVFSQKAADDFLGGYMKRFQAGLDMGQTALKSQGDIQAAKVAADAYKEAMEAKSQGSMMGGIASTIGSVAGLFLCDQRLKHDIAPLADAPAEDELAVLAHLVQWLREHA